jgi:hypothetical protein
VATSPSEQLAQAVQAPVEAGPRHCPSRKKDIPAGTLRSIAKHAGITLE